MADFPMISPLSDAELDAVSGGVEEISGSGSSIIRILQNSRVGIDSIVRGNNGTATTTTSAGSANAGVSAAVGGAATAAAGGIGGTNLITGIAVPPR
jgi:hypothetical protein